MENITVFTNSSNVEWVQITNPDGSITSMTKEYYDAQQAASTLPSNSSTPQAGA
jgi:hypothetical protein